MASVTVYAGFHQLLLYLRRPEHREDLTFALTCFTIVLYDIFCAGLYNATSPTEGMDWQRAQVMTLALLSVAFLWFIADYTAQIPKRELYAFSVYFGVTFIIEMLDRSDLTWIADQPLIKVVSLPFGLTVTYYEVTPGPFVNLQSLAGVVVAAYVLWAAIRLYRSGGQKRATPLLWAMTIFVLGVFNDTAVSSGLYQFVYTIEYAYVAMVVLMMYSLSDRVLMAGVIKEALRDSEQKFRSIVEQSQDGIVLTNAQGEIIEWNLAQEGICGVKRAEVLGRYLWDVMFQVLPDEDKTPERYEQMKAAILEVIGSAPEAWLRRKHEQGIQRPDGTRWAVEILTAPVLIGAKVMTCSVVRDITERQWTEEALRGSEARNRALLEAMPDLMFISTRDGIFVDYHAPDPRLLLTSPDQFIGRHISEIFPSALAEQFLRCSGQSLQTGESQLEYSLNLAGEVRHFEARLVSFDDKVLTLVRDITGRKQREKEVAAIVTVSAALRTAASRSEMLPIILDQTLDLLQAGGAALCIHDPVSGENVIELARGAFVATTGRRLPPGEGICGQVIATGQPYVENNTPLETDLIPPDECKDLLAVACVPLSAQGYTVGALWIGRTIPILSGELQLLTAISSIAANAIHRATLREQTEQRLQHLMALRTVDMAITASLDLHVTLNVILDQIIAQLHVDAAAVLLLDPYTLTLTYAASRGFHTRAIERSTLRLGEGIAGRAALERCTIYIPHLAEDQTAYARARLLADEAFRARCSVPLIAKGQVKGVLDIFHRAPLSPDPEWLEFLETLAGQAAIAIDNATMFDRLQRSHADLTRAYDSTLEGWIKALDLRTRETEGHTERVTGMSLQLAQAMGVTGTELAHMRRGALLHDVGKMAIPDSILLKPGPLTPDEWAIVRRHPVYAYELLSPIDYLRPALSIPYCHHEKWDGSGYPRGLAGEQIPLAARLFAVVDVWDALTSDRPYRQAWPQAKALAYIREQAGQHFDPQVVQAFLQTFALGDA